MYNRSALISSNDSYKLGFGVTGGRKINDVAWIVMIAKEREERRA